MFEGWVADLLATYLGRFVDVQKDQLKISLWGGEGWGGEGRQAVSGRAVLGDGCVLPDAPLPAFAR